MCGPGKSTEAPIGTPSAFRWAYRDSVIVTTADLVTAYTEAVGSGAMPPSPDEVLTIRPGSPPAIMRGTKAWMPWKTPHTLTAKAHFQSLTSCSHMRPSAPEPTPALLHSTCTAPKAS